MEAVATAQEQPKKSLVEIFMEGTKKGFYVGMNNILPAMVLGFVIVQFLQLSGVVDILGSIFGPVINLFGLPGSTIVVLVSAFFAKAAGAATAANMYSQGLITATQATVLIVPCMLMGTLVGHFPRVVLVANVNPKHRMLLLAIPIVDSIIGMWIVHALLLVMGL